MKRSSLILTILVGIYLVSCDSKTQNKITEIPRDSLELSASEHLTLATLWFQKAAETRAIYYQNYNLAKVSLDNQLKKAKKNTKYAVVLDIDETVLDNSPYQGMLIQKGLVFSLETWREWIKLGKAKALPGAVEFTNYAKSKGCEVFYVSNRDDDMVKETIQNLKDLNFPSADENHIYFRVNKVSTKMPRFKQIQEKYDVLLFIGDNLLDFDDVFGKRIHNYGFNTVDSLKNLFGEKYIVMPNPMYGEWEKAIYGGKYPTDKEKNSMRKKALESY